MQQLTPDEGSLALHIARKAIVQRVLKKPYMPPDAFPEVFEEERGVFVTIKEDGELRGCIGLPYPVKTLKDALIEAAVSAAVGDPRFPQLTRGELDEIELEVTVLSAPERLRCLPGERPSHIVVGTHGLIVNSAGHSGLLLPQVAPEWGWDAPEFLDATCRKAGLPLGCWKRDDTEVYTFEGQIFSEQVP